MSNHKEDLPTTEEIRYRYGTIGYDEEFFEVDGAEFDRWLQQVKANAWDAAIREARARYCITGMDHDELINDNPYREEADEPH